MILRPNGQVNRKAMLMAVIGVSIMTLNITGLSHLTSLAKPYSIHYKYWEMCYCLN